MVFKHIIFRFIPVFSSLYLLSLPSIWANDIPEIACPNYFQYLKDANGSFGKITVPGISQGRTKVEVHFSQIGDVPKPNPASFSFYLSQDETFNNILNGKPVDYRVEFPVLNVLPKLTLISVNDVVICSNEEYPAPSTTMKLTNNFELSVKTVLRPVILNVRKSNDDLANEGWEDDKSIKITKPKYMDHFSLHQKLNPAPLQLSETFKPNANNLFLFQKYAIGGPRYEIPKSDEPRKDSNPAPTEFSGIFKPNPNNMFLAKPTLEQKTRHLNDICGRESTVNVPSASQHNDDTTIKRGEFPWLAAIYNKANRDLKFRCGGSLISARTVISAAHCFLRPELSANKILVLLGRNNLESVDEEGSLQRSVRSLLTHPEYNVNAIPDADIALLELSTPVTFSHFIRPICLWNKSTNINDIAGVSAYAAGWGANENEEAYQVDKPKKITTYIANDESCSRSLGEYATMMSLRTICAKVNTGNIPCTGDSGGGLAIYTNDRWTLRGIVSAGLTQNRKCFSHEYYYFCDVGKHMDWVVDKMWV